MVVYGFLIICVQMTQIVNMGSRITRINHHFMVINGTRYIYTIIIIHIPKYNSRFEQAIMFLKYLRNIGAIHYRIFEITNQHNFHFRGEGDAFFHIHSSLHNQVDCFIKI